MINKKKVADVRKVVGITAGAVAGFAAVVAGVVVTCRYFAAKKVEKSCESCELNGDCECRGKYYECCCNSECVCEGLIISEEEFSNEGESEDNV